MICRFAWSRPLHVEPGMASDTLVTRSEAAKMLGVDRGTLKRAFDRGDGPPVELGYVGRRVWYRVSDLLLWRTSVTGVAPRSMTLCDRDRGGRARPPPEKRPTYWRKGERRYRAQRRTRTSFRSRMADIEFLTKLVEKKQTTIRRDAFNHGITRLSRSRKRPE